MATASDSPHLRSVKSSSALLFLSFLCFSGCAGAASSSLRGGSANEKQRRQRRGGRGERSISIHESRINAGLRRDFVRAQSNAQKPGSTTSQSRRRTMRRSDHRQRALADTLPEAKEIQNKTSDFDRCQGDCDEDVDCVGDLVCLWRDADQPIPGCDALPHILGGTSDYCVRKEDRSEFYRLKYSGGPDAVEIKDRKRDFDRCQGDCDYDSDCLGDLVCSLRDRGEPIVGCNAARHMIDGKSDFCVTKEDREEFHEIKTQHLPKAEEIEDVSSGFARCQGDCDRDGDCEGELVCLQRTFDQPVTGCKASPDIIGGDSDYCVRREDRAVFIRWAMLDKIQKQKFNTDTVSMGTNNIFALKKQGKLNANFVRNDPDDEFKNEEDKLGECEGDCDGHEDCRGELLCQQRTKNQAFDGCMKGDRDSSESDYCVLPKYFRPLLEQGDASVAQSDVKKTKKASANPQVKTKKTGKDNSGKSHEGRPWVVSTSSEYGPKGEFSLKAPKGLQEGDLLILFLSRSDDPLPMHIEHWKTEASCFKQDNGQKTCLTVEMCQEKASYDHDYCAYFNGKKHNGEDLATVVYSRRATKVDERKNIDGDGVISFLLPSTQRNRHPGWAILAAVRNADGVRGWAGVSCDETDHAEFASVPDAHKDDLLLLDFSYDDAAAPDQFQAPYGTKGVAYVVGGDETGILYAQEGLQAGSTSKRRTRGPGGPDCKDVNLSLVIGKA